MRNKIKELLYAIAEENEAKTQELFSEIMQQKVHDAVEAKNREVAEGIFIDTTIGKERVRHGVRDYYDHMIDTIRDEIPDHLSIGDAEKVAYKKMLKKHPEMTQTQFKNTFKYAWSVTG